MRGNPSIGRSTLMSLTDQAFDKLRTCLGSPRLPPPELIANDDQVKQMSVDDGLAHWVDGSAITKPAPSPPLLSPKQVEARHLWVVRQYDVVHAKETCSFGKCLESEVIKHTNLTGGAAAFSGGEIIFLDAETVVVNGCSGRYGPRSQSELDLAVRAFAESGYGVWSMGFDDDTNRPAQFLGIYPEWVT